ncbi:MAG: AI-2E family transporter [Chthoniobacteraceae bacterium]
MNTPEFPTPWQRKTLWSALTALAMGTIAIISIGAIWMVSRILGFMQPILIPFAVAGVMAYLLDPLVLRLCKWGTTRPRAVITVFAFVSILFIGLLIWIVPAISEQSVRLAKRIPRYTETAKARLQETLTNLHDEYNVKFLQGWPRTKTQAAPDESATPPVTVAPAEPLENSAKETSGPDGAPAKALAARSNPLTSATTGTPDEEVDAAPLEPVAPAAIPGAPRAPDAAGRPQEPDFTLNDLLQGNWLQTTLQMLGRKTWDVILSSVGGFLGVLGFFLSLIIVPVYLYYFLLEAPNIAQSWGDYLPLRASAFKDEVVSALSEINGYLFAFFRGQLVVSLINGAATGLGLVFIGLDFGLLIGLLLCVLGIIPYLGIVLCWIPAVIIASVQGGSWIIPASAPWWLFPAVVTGIFVIVQQIDGLFVTPKIVGESVGLHPMTVIVSVFAWSLLMGGLLGAILAVPLTATLKVLLKRYIWERRFRGEIPVGPVTEETFALQQALEGTEEPESMHAR